MSYDIQYCENTNQVHIQFSHSKLYTNKHYTTYAGKTDAMGSADKIALNNVIIYVVHC